MDTKLQGQIRRDMPDQVKQVVREYAARMGMKQQAVLQAAFRSYDRRALINRALADWYDAAWQHYAKENA